jgi:short-subunit dehydrogenase
MNKLAVVTGGTKGIGKAIVQRFAAAGFDVATCARKEADLQSLKSGIEASFSVKVTTTVADMANKEHIRQFAESIQQLSQPVEVLINNAGYFIPGSVLDEADGALESMINTNLYSAYNLSRLLVPAMKARKSGHIFNMCSIASIMAYPNGGSYAISKFALLGFSKVLREELKAHGVRVTSVLPGATLTASWDGVDLPDERLMKPEDVAETIFSAYSLSKRSVVEEILIRPQLGDL